MNKAMNTAMVTAMDTPMDTAMRSRPLLNHAPAHAAAAAHALRTLGVVDKPHTFRQLVARRNTEALARRAAGRPAVFCRRCAVPLWYQLLSTACGPRLRGACAAVSDWPSREARHRGGGGAVPRQRHAAAG
eukprot:231118-Chlamydomonas_euryale.AAC.3